MAAEKNVSCRTMQVILNEDLEFCPYHKRKVQGLPKSQRIKGLQRCKKLIRQHGKKKALTEYFLTRIFFCTDQSLQAKNDVTYSTAFEDVPENL